MEDNNVQETETLTKKEKADLAGKDVAEVAARGAGRYFGGALGGAAVDAALQTKAGQKIIGRASKQLNKNPITRSTLAKNQEKISDVKPLANSLVDNMGGTSDGSNIGNNNQNSSNTSDSSSNGIESKGNGSSKNNINILKDGLSGAFKKAPLKVKLIIIGVIAAFIMVMFFIVTIVASLMSIGIIDIDGMGGPSGDISFGYSSILDSSDFWWPIGSRSVDANGFASGKPSWTTITSNFGPRTHPITGVVNSFHTGVDIADGNAAGTTNVIASRSGRVVYPSISDRIDCPTSNALDGCGGGYGNYVLIDHGGGVSTLYAHLHYMTINVTAGDYVSQGEVIGKIGSSGNSTGPHLHFEVRHNGSAVEPLNYISMSNPRP